jgi:hypothetical protein
VQVTIYLTEEDSYLLRLVDEQSTRQRKSRSAVILSIIEEHFEKGRRLGEILIDLGVLSEADLARALALQKETFADKLLGDVLASEHGVEEESIVRALTIQRRFTEPARQVQRE